VNLLEEGYIASLEMFNSAGDIAQSEMENTLPNSQLNLSLKSCHLIVGYIKRILKISDNRLFDYFSLVKVFYSDYTKVELNIDSIEKLLKPGSREVEIHGIVHDVVLIHERMSRTIKTLLEEKYNLSPFFSRIDSTDINEAFEFVQLNAEVFAKVKIILDKRVKGQQVKESDFEGLQIALSGKPTMIKTLGDKFMNFINK